MVGRLRITRQQVPSHLRRPEATEANGLPTGLLAACLQSQGKDTKVLRALYYLLEVYVGPGSAGTPTLYDPSLGERMLARAVPRSISGCPHLLACFLCVCGSGMSVQ